MAGALQQRNFRLLWGGQFVSDFGRQLTIFAFPTIAILGLHARAETVTALTGSEYAVIPLFAMLAGLLIDRWRRRHTMIIANLVRLTALASVPLAAALHALTMPHLIAVAAIVSFAGLFFDTAYQPLLVTVVGRAGYERGNARMTLSAQAAAALGNAFGGPLVTLLGAPVSLVANVATYVFGTAALVRMRAPEQRAARDDRSFRREFRDGARTVGRDPLLRTLALATSLYYFGGMLVDALLPLYAYRTLHLTPFAFGCVLALASLAVAVSGGLASTARKVGPIALLAVAAIGTAAGDLLCLSAVLPLLAIVAGRAIVAMCAPAYEMTLQSTATARVEDHMLGRMNATLRTVTNASLPVACFCAGLLSSRFGFVAVMAGGSVAMVLAALALLAASRGKKPMCSFSTTTISVLPYAA